MTPSIIELWQFPPAFFGKLPMGVRQLVASLVRRKMRRKMRRDLQGQGMGRHKPGEIIERLCADIDATAEILGAQPFFAGNDPGAIDACIYAFMANLLWAPFDTPARMHAQTQDNLVAYAERMKSRVGVI